MTNPSYTSPWLVQLKADRPHFTLDGNTSCDVAIVGAGIAGIATAYHTLKYTDNNVLLIEAGRIAHGATGRNAGQVVNYFERPLTDIAKAFSMEMAADALAHVESAWGILEDIHDHCALKTPLHMCAGYEGYSTVEQIIAHLEEQPIVVKAGVHQEKLLLRADIIDRIPESFHTFITCVPASVILDVLETSDTAYIAAKRGKKGCMNSALFCEELTEWMVQAYPDRCRIVEHAPVETITLHKEYAELQTNAHLITAKHVVLCTNGFENFTIKNLAGDEIDTAFHDIVRGRIGYMAGYNDEPDQVPAALCFYQKTVSDAPYYYLTRRPFDHEGKSNGTLICIGGPERALPNDATYDPHVPFPADVEEELDESLRQLYADKPPLASRSFVWQGLMGYTKNGLRRIGYEPNNHTLLYNLGCNGVGILPSIYGGKRIAELLMGITLPPSIFDPVFGDK